MKITAKRQKYDIPKNSFQRKAKIFRVLILLICFLILACISMILLCKMEDIIEGRGIVAGKREYYMKSRVRSTISGIFFRSGDFVKKGQIMLTLDDRDYQENCLKLKNSISELEAEIKAAESALTASRLDPLPKEYRHAEISLKEYTQRIALEKESLTAFRNLQKSGAVPFVEINRREIEFIHNQGELERIQRDVRLIKNGLPQAIIGQKEAELALLSSEIDDFKKKQSVINEEILRRRELEEKQDFFRVLIGQQEIDDIQCLLSIREKLIYRENLDKLIYDVYISKSVADMIKRVLKGAAPSGIYKITRLKTGEIYIGKSTDVKKRWTEHCKTAYGVGTIAHSILHTTIRKDGIENFTFELLEEVPKGKLTEREKYWITFYDSKNYGLNERNG